VKPITLRALIREALDELLQEDPNIWGESLPDHPRLNPDHIKEVPSPFDEEFEENPISPDHIHDPIKKFRPGSNP
jgi:hypothetical protein